MSDWIPWSGGECPVGPDILVDIRFSDGREFFGEIGCRFDWHNDDSFGDIIAYRPHQAAQPVAAAPVTGDEQRAWDMFAAAALHWILMQSKQQDARKADFIESAATIAAAYADALAAERAKRMKGEA